MNIPITNKTFQESARNAEEAKKLLLIGSKILANEKVFDAFGHLSIRNPETLNTFFMSRAVSPELMVMGDIIELDLEGNIVASPDKSFRPFGERFIHCAIYAVRPDVNSICHSHPLELLPFASSDIPLRSIFHQDVTFSDGIPVFDDMPEESGFLINDLQIGRNLVACLGSRRGILIRNHGIVVTGESMARTVYSSITVRDNAIALSKALSMNAQISYIPEAAQLAGMQKQFTYGLVRSWNYWKYHAVNNFPELKSLSEI